jgi:hypothetical protein
MKANWIPASVTPPTLKIGESSEMFDLNGVFLSKSYVGYFKSGKQAMVNCETDIETGISKWYTDCSEHWEVTGHLTHYAEQYSNSPNS